MNTNIPESDGLPVWAWCLFVSILLVQATWLFLDARRRDANPWFWGIWGCIQCPTPLIVYLLLVRGGWKAIRKVLKGRKKNGQME